MCVCVCVCVLCMYEQERGMVKSPGNVVNVEDVINVVDSHTRSMQVFSLD